MDVCHMTINVGMVDTKFTVFEVFRRYSAEFSISFNAIFIRLYQVFVYSKREAQSSALCRL